MHRFAKHVRPIVRGKAGKPVEFGAKISLSHLPGGFVTLDRLSWDAYNEQGDLIGQIESCAALKSLLDALITCFQDRQRQVRRLRQAIEELTGLILRKMRESQAENRRTN